MIDDVVGRVVEDVPVHDKQIYMVFFVFLLVFVVINMLHHLRSVYTNRIRLHLRQSFNVMSMQMNSLMDRMNAEHIL